MVPQLCFFVSIAFSFIAWGIVTARYVWPKLRLQQRGEACGHCSLCTASASSLHRIGIPGPRCFVARSAVCLRAFRGLWRHHCGDARLAFAVIAAQRGWRFHHMGLQSLGHAARRQAIFVRPSENSECSFSSPPAIQGSAIQAVRVDPRLQPQIV